MKDFKELKVWQEAHKLTLDIYKLTSNFPKEERLGLVSQVRRSSSSISSNIIEGNGRFYLNEGIRYLYIARGSLYETEGHLILAKDLKYIDGKSFNQLNEKVVLVGKLINGLLRAIKGRKITNNKSENSELTTVN